MKKIYFFIAMLLCCSEVWAQAEGDFRSAATGNWNATATWEVYNGTSWIAAGATPTNADGVISIRSGHVVTISAAGLIYDQVVVDAGGQVTVAPTITTTMANGSGTDLTINGTWLHSGGTWTVTGTTWTVGAGGTYIHNTTASAATPLGLATLDPASNFIYRGNSTLTPAVSTSGRTYGNLSFESTSGSYSVSPTGGGTLTVNGNFTLGSNVTVSTSQTGVMTFAGNFTQNGTLTNGTGTQIYTFTGSGKTISGSGTISFEALNINAGASIILGNNISIASTFTAAINGTLDCGTNAVTGAGAFTLGAAGALKMGSPLGITSVAASGNIQVTGTRTYSSTALYEYKGGAAQVTGDQLPATIGQLVINNASGVTLTSNIIVSTELTLTSGTLSLGASGLTVAGALTKTSGNIDASSSTVSFTNTSLLTLPSGTFSGDINNLTLNGTGGVTLSSATTVTGNLILTNGNLNTTGVNLLTYTGVGAGGGGSAASHVNGPMARTGGTDYVFPIGNATLYRPISVSGLSGSATITASYIRSNPYTAVGSVFALGINHISACEYWDLDDGASSVTGVVELQFGTNCNAGTYVDDPPSLLVAHWNGSQWDNLGNNGSATFTNVKAVTSSSFSPFTIGSSTSLNPLPITIDYFNGTKQGTTHNLVWKVTCQSTPSATLILERSTDGRNYKEIYSIVATALRCQQPFDYTSTQPEAGTNYYRLKMIDANGKTSYSSIVALLNKQSGFELVGLAPNPVTSNAVLNVTAAQAGTLQIAVTDMNGRKVMTQSATLQAGSKQVTMNLSKLPMGTYQVTAYYSDGTKQTIRLVKQ